MRVALLGPAYPFKGGIAHYTTLLYQELRRRHPTRFFSFHATYPRWLYPGSDPRDRSRWSLPAAGAEPIYSYLNPWSWLRVALELRRDRTELLILPWWSSFWTLPYSLTMSSVRLLSSARILLLCHNLLDHDARFWSDWCSRLVTARAHLFVVHDADNFERLRRLRPNARLARVDHPVYSVFNRGALEPAEAKRRLDLEGPVLLVFGYVRPYKGVDLAIRALPAVVAARSVTMVVAGEFWEPRRRYQELIEQLGLRGRVRLEDRYIPNEEVEVYFAAADLVVLPYRSATQSGILQLARGFGKRVVATDVGGIGALVRQSGSGTLVAANDPLALAQAILAELAAASSTQGEVSPVRVPPRPGEELAGMRMPGVTEASWSNLVDAIERLAAQP